MKFYNLLWKIYILSGRRHLISAMFCILHERRDFRYQDNVGQRYLDGYWQNVRYFAEIREVLLEEFRYMGKLSAMQQQVVEEMRTTNSVMLHVRRGDYLIESTASMYVNLQKEYYDAALKYIEDRVPGRKVFVFSDDIEWCKKEFSDLQEVIFVDKSISTNQHTDLEMMKSCKYFVIANSTFSWWGAWLSTYHNKIVVAPQNWFRDKRMNSEVQQALLRDAILL